MSHNPFDPFDGYRSFNDLSKLAGINDISKLAGVNDLSKLAGVSDYTRLIDDIQNNAVRWAREQEGLANITGRARWLCNLEGEASHRDALIDSLSTNRLAGNQLLVFDPSAFQNVASSLSALNIDVPHDLLGVIPPKHFLDSLGLGHQSALESSRGLTQLTVDFAKKSDAFGLNGVGAMGGLSFAQTITTQLESMFPASYAKNLGSLVEGIDFDAIQAAAMGARQRLIDDFADGDRLRSFEDLEEAVEDAKLAAVRQVVDEAVSAAIRKAAAEGRFSGGQVPWFVFNTLVSIVLAVAQIIGQPMFQHWYEQQNLPEPVAHPVAPSVPSVGARGIVVVTAPTLYMRLGPHTTQRIVTTTEHGNLLHVLNRKNGWARVRYVDPLGEGVSYTGWVKLKYTQPIEAETAKMIWCALTADVDAQDDGGCDD